MTLVPLQLDVDERIGKTSGLLLRPEHAWAGYVVAHGAGAGMRHPFMEAIANALAQRDVATLRYQFPYMESGGKRPDSPGVLEATVRAAVAKANEVMPDLPLVAGGKSMGGRMTSNAAAHGPLPGILGLVFFGFPLHPPKQPGERRADHLSAVEMPMLFLQGTRDTFADIDLITTVCNRLGPAATLHLVDGADHSFAVLKRSGRMAGEVMDELADTMTEWCRLLVQSAAR